MSLPSRSRRPRPSTPNGKSGWALELILAGALALRCVPSYGLEEGAGNGGDQGSGGEAGMEASGNGGSAAGISGEAGGNTGGTTGGSAGATSGAGDGGDAGVGRGGGAGDGGSGDAAGTGPSSGSGGTAVSGAGGGSGKAGAGGMAGAGRGGGGVGGASGAGMGGSAGSGGSGVVRTCGSGGAPYVWANWCMPNHPGEGPHPQSYDTSMPGIVRDRVTGLVWEHPTNGVFAQRTFAQAPSHCTDLRAAVYGGYDDWRVPSIIELVSITDYAVFEPAIDTAAFPGTPSTNFWTSQPGGVESWIVSAQYGVVTTENPSLLRNVRCVR